MVGVFLGLMILSEIVLLIYGLVKKTRAYLEAKILWLIQALAIGAYFIFSPHGTTFSGISFSSGWLYLLYAEFSL